MVTVLTENKLHLSIVASENIQDLLEEDTSNQWRRHNHISSAVRIYVRISFRVHHLVTKIEHTRVEDAERMQDWYKKKLSEN